MSLVSLDQDVKPYLEIPLSNTSSDDVLGLCMEASISFFETYTNRVLEEQDLTHDFNGNGTHVLMLREWPVSQVTAVYLDSDWVFASAMDSSEYMLDNEAFVVRKTVWDKGTRNVRVAYTAGYTVEECPPDLQQASLMMIEFLWRMRADQRLSVTNRAKNGETLTFQESIPKSIIDILNGYKRDVAAQDLLRRAGG